MTKNILESIILIIISATFAMILTWPKYQEYANENMMVKQKMADLESRQEYYKKLELTAAELKNYGPNLTKIDSALPDNANIAQLASYLESSAKQDGLIVSNFDYSFDKAASLARPAASESAKKTVKQYRVSLKLIGPYVSWKNFSSRIEKSSRLIEVENVIVSSTPQKKEQLSTKESLLDYDVKLMVRSY